MRNTSFRAKSGLRCNGGYQNSQNVPCNVRENGLLGRIIFPPSQDIPIITKSFAIFITLRSISFQLRFGHHITLLFHEILEFIIHWLTKIHRLLGILILVSKRFTVLWLPMFNTTLLIPIVKPCHPIFHLKNLALKTILSMFVQAPSKLTIPCR